MENAIKTTVERFSDMILSPIIYLLVVVAVIIFFWGLVQFIFTSEDTNRQKGKSHMVWGIVGLFIIFSVWGIMNIIQDTLNNVEKPLDSDNDGILDINEIPGCVNTPSC